MTPNIVRLIIFIGKRRRENDTLIIIDNITTHKYTFLIRQNSNYF